MSDKEQSEYIAEALGLHYAKEWAIIKPYQVKALCDFLDGKLKRMELLERVAQAARGCNDPGGTSRLNLLLAALDKEAAAQPAQKQGE